MAYFDIHAEYQRKRCEEKYNELRKWLNTDGKEEWFEAGLHKNPIFHTHHQYMI